MMAATLSVHDLTLKFSFVGLIQFIDLVILNIYIYILLRCYHMRYFFKINIFKR